MGKVNHEGLLLLKIDAEYHMGNYDEMEKAYYMAFETLQPNENMLQNAVALANILYRSCVSKLESI